MSEESKVIERDFQADLKKAIQTVCRSHGVDFGSLRGWKSESGLYLMNLCLHEDSIDKAYEELYLLKAEDIGLSKGWLGSFVKNPYSNESIKILGLDPDGGQECVRVESYSGERLNIKPSELLRLMTKS